MFTEHDLLEAKGLIKELNHRFQACKKQSLDDASFQTHLNDIWHQLSSTKHITNKTLIQLEKFYQSCSLLIGLSSLTLDADTHAAWRDYDAFHYAHVKPNLKLYGPTIIL